MKKIALLFAAAMFLAAGCCKTPTQKFISSKFRQYADSSAVNQMVFVFWYGQASDAEVIMYTRSEGGRKWQEALHCDGHIGKNGLNANRVQGDMTTPTGDYGILESFGLKENPGTKLPYFVVEDYHWCCGEPEYGYNKIIDIRDCPHECTGEHLINYDPAYNYSIFFDFNKECTPGRGMAIFFHCNSSHPYTSGCVAVEEEDMVTIMQTLDMGARIIIEDFS